MNILGVRIDGLTKNEALAKAAGFLTGPAFAEATAGKLQHKIFTPNPEMIVKAQKDEYFRQVLNGGDLNLCDGGGLWIAMSGNRKQEIGNKKCERIAGVDFMIDVCRLAEQKEKSIYLLGSGSEEVVRGVVEKLQNQFPKLVVAGYDKGPDIHENFQFSIFNFQSINNVTIEQFNNASGLLLNEQENEFVLSKINAVAPDIIFVAFGMGKQEKWIAENLANLPSVKIAMGVGGAFDYISGKTKRAPLLMRKIGLEWMYRLVKQPQRFLRIWNATFKFCYLVIKEKIL